MGFTLFPIDASLTCAAADITGRAGLQCCMKTTLPGAILLASFFFMLKKPSFLDAWMERKNHTQRSVSLFVDNNFLIRILSTVT